MKAAVFGLTPGNEGEKTTAVGNRSGHFDLAFKILETLRIAFGDPIIATVILDRLLHPFDNDQHPRRD